MKPQQIWAMVVIVSILVAATTTLVILDKDVSVILTLVALVALPVLGALGGAVYQRLGQLNDKTDNNMHQKSTDQLTNLALSMTPPPAPAEGEEQKTEEVR